VSLDTVEWKLSPARHEGGTPNLLGAISLAAGFAALDGIGFDTVFAHEMGLYERLLTGLARLEIPVLRIWPEHSDLVGVASFNVPGYAADLVAAYLSAEHTIGVRGGKFCAHPLLVRFGLGDRGVVRASIGLGTSDQDIDALLTALELLLRDGPQWHYSSVDGYLSPDPDPRGDPAHTGRAAIDRRAQRGCSKPVIAALSDSRSIGPVVPDQRHLRR
jgi:hypothetical protein